MQDMLKILIVDDEYNIRFLLKNCVDWKGMGAEIIGEASCAKEAMEMVETTLPDIIFTDICMPLMDGITFAAEVVEKYPHIKIVVLTGYDEFEYAQRSIKIGIADFLLKPINDEEIIKVFFSLKNKIESERVFKEEYLELKKQYEENRPYLIEKLFNQLLQNAVSKDAFIEGLSYYKIDRLSDTFQVAVIETDLASCEENIHEEERLLLNIKTINRIKKYFRNDQGIHIFYDNSRRIVLLNNNDAIDFNVCSEEIKAMIINQLNCYITIGIGSLYNGVDNIRLSYKEALNALRYKVVVGKNHIIHYSDIAGTGQGERYFSNEWQEAFCFFLKAGIEDKCLEIIKNLFEEVLLVKTFSTNTLNALTANIVSLMLNVLAEMNLGDQQGYKDRVRVYEDVFNIQTLPEMTNYINKLISDTISDINTLKTKKVNSIINQIIDYIHEHLGSCDLSLSSVAQRFYLNASYLSRIFKKETGQTFVAYVTKLRMEKAIEIFRESDEKVYEIAEKVGFEDAHYFSICFKKYTGMSVNDYRKRK